MQKLLSGFFLLFVIFIASTTGAPAAVVAESKANEELITPVMPNSVEGVDAVKDGCMTANFINNEKIENGNNTCLEVGQRCQSGGECCSHRCLTYAGKCVS